MSLLCAAAWPLLSPRFRVRPSHIIAQAAQVADRRREHVVRIVLGVVDLSALLHEQGERLSRALVRHIADKLEVAKRVVLVGIDCREESGCRLDRPLRPAAAALHDGNELFSRDGAITVGVEGCERLAQRRSLRQAELFRLAPERHVSFNGSSSQDANLDNHDACTRNSRTTSVNSVKLLNEQSLARSTAYGSKPTWILQNETLRRPGYLTVIPSG